MSSILADQQRSRLVSPNAGGVGGDAGSQPMSTAVHRSPNKIWRSNSIFNLTVSRDFLLLVFFHDSVSPQPQSVPLGPCWIFRKFAEIFASQGAPPVSTTPVENLPPVSLVVLIPVATPVSTIRMLRIRTFLSLFDFESGSLFSLWRGSGQTFYVDANQNQSYANLGPLVYRPSTAPFRAHTQLRIHCEPPHSSWFSTLIRIRIWIGILLLPLMRIRIRNTVSSSARTGCRFCIFISSGPRRREEEEGWYMLYLIN